MEDNDTQALREASAAVTSVDVAYRLADGPGQYALSEARDQAWTAYALARQKLLMAGIVTSDRELDALAALRTDLEEATQVNAIAGAAARLAGILTRIALA